MRDKKTINILIVDDGLVRRWLSMLMSRHYGLQVVGEAATAEEARQKATDLQPDVVLIDLHLPDESGIQVCRDIRSQNTNIRVIMLTQYSNNEAVISTLLAGAAGYLLKDVRSQEIIGAVRKVAGGYSLLDRPTAERELEALCQIMKNNSLCQLNTAEQEALRFIVEGQTDKQIADTMLLSYRDARKLVSEALHKIQGLCRSQVASYTMQWQVRRTFRFSQGERGKGTLQALTGWEYNYLGPGAIPPGNP